MTTQNPCAIAPVVSIVKNQVTALSTDVAQFFGKIHRNVVRDIEELCSKLPTSRLLNFEQSEISIPSNLNNTSNRIIKAYRMTRDGFTLLVMGWTGEKALQFKLAWLDAFNAMEEQLRKQQCLAENNLATLTPAQQYQIQIAVAARAQKTAHNYQTIYRALKNRYQVARYDQIPQSQFQDALKFIQCVDLNVPETPITTAPPETYVVDEDFLKTLQVFCYYQRYLFRKPLMQAMRVMLALDVPDASKLWDSANDFNFVKLERLLDDLGFSVKELDCYKHWALTHTA